MGTKILVIGGVAGGASAATRARRLSEDAQIILFERGNHVSYSNCSLPFYLSRTIHNSNDLVMMTPELFLKRFNIQVRIRSEVIEINRNNKTIIVHDLENDRKYEEAYDKLVLSPGASPLRPRSIEGVGAKNVFTIRNVDDICALDQYLELNDVKSVSVIGGGFIGIEVAENLREAGKDVSLIEAMDQVLTPFDEDMAQLIHKELYDNGVKLYLGDPVSSILENGIILKSGRFVDSQAVVLSIGVRPETDLAVKAGLHIGVTGSIKVDRNNRTSDPDIYAVGDAVESFSSLTRRTTKLTLAGPAQLQARNAADHIFNIQNTVKGVLGSSVLRIFQLNAASTGLNEKAAQSAGIPYEFSYVIAKDKVGLMPGSNDLHFKLIFEYPTGKILGAQAIGKGDADKRIDIIAALIGMGATVEDLKKTELCYSPLFGTPRDVVNQAALVATNLLAGRFKQVPVSMARQLVESGAYIIDVREQEEYAACHLKNSVNIPLGEFREHLSEIPRDRPVYVHCRSAQRSYNAVMILQNSGFSNVYNMSGSFLGICCYEYFHDCISNREKVVTAYNFC